MAVFKCKMCGGQLEIGEASRVGICEYCGTEQTLPRLDSDKKANMYDRANHFRRNNDYDKAMSIYEQILNEDNTDSEAYWSLVLCRYGIEYVEDPVTHKRIPTVNRAQFVSIYADEDYKSAIEYADESQKTVYEQEAKTIESIQRGILAISEKEEPFDIFICYKETDDAGKRTPDSVLANDLYHQLTQEGFKVFFARITLEDKLGQEYEPYIFAALHSAKVMIALGTKPEHFNAVWVKNEWSRYISLISKGEKKMLIPAYKDMDPYDLPEEFSHLQAQDMSKLGFVQDIIRGIKKIIRPESQQQIIQKETVVVNSQGVPAGNYAALLKRGNIALDDGEWEKADGFFEEVLNQNAECAEAYLGKMLVKYEKRNIVAFITYLEEKYSEFEAEELIACEVDTEHITEMEKKYCVKDCLHNRDISSLYEFDRKYKTTIKSVETQKENALAELQNDKLFIRARQYATGETINLVESIVTRLTDLFDRKIKEISDNDSKVINRIKKAYKAHVADADMTVKIIKYGDEIEKVEHECDIDSFKCFTKNKEMKRRVLEEIDKVVNINNSIKKQKNIVSIEAAINRIQDVDLSYINKDAFVLQMENMKRSINQIDTEKEEYLKKYNLQIKQKNAELQKLNELNIEYDTKISTNKNEIKNKSKNVKKYQNISNECDSWFGRFGIATVIVMFFLPSLLDDIISGRLKVHNEEWIAYIYFPILIVLIIATIVLFKNSVKYEEMKNEEEIAGTNLQMQINSLEGDSATNDNQIRLLNEHISKMKTMDYSEQKDFDRRISKIYEPAPYIEIVKNNYYYIYSAYQWIMYKGKHDDCYSFIIQNENNDSSIYSQNDCVVFIYEKESFVPCKSVRIMEDTVDIVFDNIVDYFDSQDHFILLMA